MSAALDVELTCPKRAQHHQPGMPDGYIDRQDWFKAMAKTHRQTRCKGCGLYAIWVPKVTCAKCGRLIVNVWLHEWRHHREAKR